MSEGLHELFSASAARHSGAVAVRDPGRGTEVSYQELDRLSERVRQTLERAGVRPGDRVGLCLPKSIASVAGILGTLKAGATYVPVDPDGPAARAAYVFRDCAVTALLADASRIGALAAQLEAGGPSPALLPLTVDDAEHGLGGLDGGGDERPGAVGVELDATAYILYTSGSTGRPKGVVLSHRNALSFLAWCSAAFEPRSGDVFSSHAPFHFDLSILDLFLSLKHGAAVVLVGEEVAKNPKGMVELALAERVSIWYSTPSVLTLMVLHGAPEAWRELSLRLVLFAGEVFPVKHLRRLRALTPRARLFNLYGPTETNVCTFHEIPEEVPAERVEPYPIGAVCAHLEGLVVDEAGRGVATGEEGELVIRGPGVMKGYWNLPERSAQAFLGSGSDRWYRTGDVVRADADGILTYVGRRDRMVKRRGYRIELGEIEATLYNHPEITEVAVVAVSDEDGVTIRAHYCTPDGERLSLIALRTFCARHLPVYMVPDEFQLETDLPRTSTDKLDHRALVERA